MRFQIAEIQTRVVDHALIASRIVVSPAGRHDVSRFLAVAVRDESGITGFGEAATTALWSGETGDSAQLIIENIFAPRLLNRAFDHPREVLAVMDEASYGNAFTKSALDCAVWDLWARKQNVRASSLFGDRSPLTVLPTRASIGCYDVETSVRIACEFWQAGIRHLKFKVGMARFDDVARLRAVREKLSDAPVLSVDANGAYETLEEAVRAIEALASYNIAIVEQPTPRDRIHLLSEVKNRVSTPIMADECIFTPDDLREALDRDACDIVSLYPGKNGGLTHSIEMAKLAQKFGKVCSIGSNLESDLGQGAMVALASALSAFPVGNMICDLPAALFYQSSPLKNPLKFEDGKIEVPGGIGFGVEPLTT